MNRTCCTTKYINEESLEVTRTVPLNLTWSGLGMKRQLSFSFGIPSLSISGSQASPSPLINGTVQDIKIRNETCQVVNSFECLLPYTQPNIKDLMQFILLKKTFALIHFTLKSVLL